MCLKAIPQFIRGWIENSLSELPGWHNSWAPNFCFADKAETKTKQYFEADREQHSLPIAWNTDSMSRDVKLATCIMGAKTQSLKFLTPCLMLHHVYISRTLCITISLPIKWEKLSSNMQSLENWLMLMNIFSCWYRIQFQCTTSSS